MLKHLLLNKKLFRLIKFVLILPLLLSVSSCDDFHPEEIKNLNQGKVLRIGHGGLGFVSFFPFNPYPANSFKALKLALEEYKADGIEVDVQMTSDEKLVLYHDNFLDSKTQLSDCVSSHSFENLVGSPYTLGVPYDWFQNETIIGLDNVLAYLKFSKQTPLLHLDVRHFSHCLNTNENQGRMFTLIDHLLKSLNRFQFPLEKVLINSSSIELCNYIKNKELSVLVSFEVNSDVELWLAKIHSAEIKYMTVKPQLLTKELSGKIHDLGIQVITFGGTRKSWNVELLEKNPDIIQTNNLSALNELLLE